MRHTDIQVKSLLIMFTLFIFITINGCHYSSSASPISRTNFFFDTVITITLYDDKQSALLDECMQLCENYEELFSRTISGSEISKINQTNGEAISVSEETVDIIEDSLYYNKLSDGAFDITIGSVNSLWNFTDTHSVPPSDELITAGLQHVGSENIHVKGQTIALTDADSKIDLGGIAKGYIADSLKEYLVKNGVTHAIIDLGGNILTIGNKPDGTPYNIGIKKPFDPEGSVITSVSVSDKSVVTSGTYERYFNYDGKLYHHVLSPFTGYPTDNELNSVTILSDDSVTGDALSTACLVLGLDDGMKLIESLPDVEALFITTDNELIPSPGFPTN